MCLADWGAEVIKVEPPKFDPGRSKDPNDTNEASFNAYNRGKKGIIINSKDPDGDALMHKLIASADVFLTSYRTDALVRMGLDWESLHAKYPKLVWAQVNGFGDEGPDAAAPGFDTVAYWARSGATADFVQEGAPIIIPPVAFGDVNSGAVLAGGIAAALYGRDRTGVGEKVMVSLYGNALYNMTYPIYDVQTGGHYPKRRTDVAIPMMNSFLCKDGRWIYMAVLEYDRYYPTIMRLIGREDLLTDESFNTAAAGTAHKAQLTAILDEGFLKHTQAEWDQILTEADIAHSTIRTISEALTDAQALDNKYIFERTLRDGKTKMKYVASPVKFGNVEIPDVCLAPRRGEDTVELMRGLGYSDESIREMAERGVVKAIFKD